MFCCIPFNKNWMKDVVVLERKTIASGTTWAAAGLVSQMRQNRQMTNLAKYATELYANLEAETGVATGYVDAGSIMSVRPMPGVMSGSELQQWQNPVVLMYMKSL